MRRMKEAAAFGAGEPRSTRTSFVGARLIGGRIGRLWDFHGTRNNNMRAGLSMDSCCEQTGRKAYLMEMDPLYCDVIVQRWEQFTGKKAER